MDANEAIRIEKQKLIRCRNCLKQISALDTIKYSTSLLVITNDKSSIYKNDVYLEALAKEEENQKIVNKLTNLISLLDKDKKRIIELYYFENLTIQKIAEKINYSVRQTQRNLHNTIVEIACLDNDIDFDNYDYLEYLRKNKEYTSLQRNVKKCIKLVFKENTFSHYINFILKDEEVNVKDIKKYLNDRNIFNVSKQREISFYIYYIALAIDLINENECAEMMKRLDISQKKINHYLDKVVELDNEYINFN